MIKVEEISFSYQDKLIFDRFSMYIDQGERICLMAPSGRGKTTLLRLLTGHLQPDIGRISGMENVNISMVFQEDRLCEGYTVCENILLGCVRGMMPEPAHSIGGDCTSQNCKHREMFLRKTIVDGHLSAVGLARTIDMPVSSLSGGMKRRVCLVRAMLSRSDIVILDEPFAGIDRESTEQVIDYIDQNLQERSLIMVSHNVREPEALGARIIHL